MNAKPIARPRRCRNDLRPKSSISPNYRHLSPSTPRSFIEVIPAGTQRQPSLSTQKREKKAVMKVPSISRLAILALSAMPSAVLVQGREVCYTDSEFIPSHLFASMSAVSSPFSLTTLGNRTRPLPLRRSRMVLRLPQDLL